MDFLKLIQSHLYAKSSIPISMKIFGILPIISVGLHHLYNIQQKETANTLWICHISALLITIGLFFSIPFLIRCAFYWVVLGAILWILYAIQSNDFSKTTIFSHSTGLFIGIGAIYQVKMKKGSWAFAFIWFILLQQFCRYTTPKALNVNIAHQIGFGGENFFEQYWHYWCSTLILLAFTLWLLEMFLWYLVPGLSPETI